MTGFGFQFTFVIGLTALPPLMLFFAVDTTTLGLQTTFIALVPESALVLIRHPIGLSASSQSEPSGNDLRTLVRSLLMRWDGDEDGGDEAIFIDCDADAFQVLLS